MHVCARNALGVILWAKYFGADGYWLVAPWGASDLLQVAASLAAPRILTHFSDIQLLASPIPPRDKKYEWLQLGPLSQRLLIGNYHPAMMNMTMRVTLGTQSNERYEWFTWPERPKISTLF